ncbi:MAG: response regulator [Alloprevotella sp.]|nr:response regulator [Alloprevotella sp.]
MKKSRILIAEDERDLAGILRDTLVTLDFAVTLAHDGASALEAYAAERPDLLVTDVMMPVMDGFSLIKQLRQVDA